MNTNPEEFCEFRLMATNIIYTKLSQKKLALLRYGLDSTYKYNENCILPSIKFVLIVISTGTNINL